MRGYKKGFFIVISVLLCSVMITTTALSGTLAKYTTSSSSSDSARVAKWGVTAEIALSDEIKNSGATIVTNNENGKISHTITNLKMAPGYDYSDAFQISISGKSEVRLKIRFDIAVDYDLENFTVPAGVGGLSIAQAYVPFGYNVGFLNKNNIYETVELESAWATRGPWGTSGVNTYLKMNFGNITDFTMGTDNRDNIMDFNSVFLEKVFEPGEKIVFHPGMYYPDPEYKDIFTSVDVNDFDFGLFYPFEKELTYNSSTYELDADEIEIWLADVGESKLDSISFNITIEQVSGDYETYKSILEPSDIRFVEN